VGFLISVSIFQAASTCQCLKYVDRFVLLKPAKIMAKRQQFSMSVSERRRRTFSENFKKEKVRQIELGILKVSQVSKQYEVTTVNVYRWIAKFSTMKDKKERLIVESQSDTVQLLELKKKIAELERVVGQKQILLEFKDKMIELAEEQYGIDIKKKFSTLPSDISGTEGNNTAGT
jgi:transposase